MPKPKGGRGQKAPYQTKLMRVPVPLEEQINQLVERYQTYLQIIPEADINNPPNLIDSSQSKLINLITALEEVLSKNSAKEKGYQTNSFSQGIKDLKEITITLEFTHKL